MVGQIKFIANHESEKYTRGTFAEFIDWLEQQKMFQFDIETNVTDWYSDRKLISMQFGSCTSDRVQWFIQWSELTEIQRKIIKKYLEDLYRTKLIHNAAYEYIICRFYGIILENVYDTMLAEKVLMGGIEIENYALADISFKYLRIIMDKSLQMAFGDNIITDAKILYGITDVAYLDVIRSLQLMKARLENLTQVISLENDVVLAFSDITFNGMLLDKEKWRENERLAWPLFFEAKQIMNEYMEKEPFRKYAIQMGYLSEQDRSTINYNSHQQKAELLQQIFPDIVGGGLAVIKKYLEDNPCNLDPEARAALEDVFHKDYNRLTRYMLKHHRDFLIDKEYLIPANKVTINWNSTDQVLPIAQMVEPRIKDLSEESRNRTTHKLIRDLEIFKKRLKLLNDLGENWIMKYVGPDGYVRTNFNQIVSTGRVSSSNPNMQNIIVDEFVGTRYRNAFICEPDEVFVDSDYISQELVLIAFISKDPVWMEAIRNGWDLHSICAELVYGNKWKEAQEWNCTYYNTMYYHKATKAWMKALDYELMVHRKEDVTGWVKQGPKQKCECKKHKYLRTGVKTINFGLAYGMSEYKLAGELSISVKEAMTLIRDYFRAFPAIGSTLDFLGRFGVENGYIITLAPFFRKRWFPYWREWSNYIEAHIKGIKHVPVLGEVERASKNHPIQGSSADVTKVALILVREYIRDNNLWDKIKLRAQVHDQITTTAKRDIAEEWKIKMDELMVEAGKVVVPTGILKAETNITATWTK